MEYFDEWKSDALFLRDVAEMLDNVLQYFIDNAPSAISRAIYSATRERSIGIGALGWHAYLQKNSIPWESAMAVGRNHQIFKHIRTGLDNANLKLGHERGCAPDMANDIEIEFEDGIIINYKPNELVMLVDGTTKLASNIDENDEIKL